jgi:predicted ATPase
MALGYADRALGRAREGVACARTLAHPYSLVCALFFESLVQAMRGNPRAQREHAAEVIALSNLQGFPLFRGVGRILHGLARVMAGEGVAALAELGEGFTLAAGTGDEALAALWLSFLALGQHAAGQHAEALGTVERGIAMAAETRQHRWDADLYHLKGVLLLATEPARVAEGEALFHRALDIARAQEAKSFELRAATSLARLWQRQGKRAEARALLAPVYGWFTEGFDTRDLVEANALLHELT